MRKTFSEMVGSFLKSIGGGDTDADEKKEEEGTVTDPDENENEEDVQKSNGDLLDVTDIMKALVGEIKTLNKSLESLAARQDGIEKAQEDIGEAIVGVAELVSRVANAPLPKKTTMAKGGFGNGATGGGDTGRLPEPEFNKAMTALRKAVAEKRISVHEFAGIETELQKAMQIPGYRMSQDDLALINQELKTA
jgi:hypothetical protein